MRKCQSPQRFISLNYNLISMPIFYSLFRSRFACSWRACCSPATTFPSFGPALPKIPLIFSAMPPLFAAPCAILSRVSGVWMLLSTSGGAEWRDLDADGVLGTLWAWVFRRRAKGIRTGPLIWWIHCRKLKRPSFWRCWRSRVVVCFVGSGLAFWYQDCFVIKRFCVC